MTTARLLLIGRFMWLYSLSLVLPTAYFNPRRDQLLKEWEALEPAQNG